MHEMSICEGILMTLEDQAKQHDFKTIRRVRLEIGRFAGVDPKALHFAWEVVMRGSPAEGSALEIIDLPGQAACFDCGEAVEIEERFAPCPLCGGGRLSPMGGDEMRIKDLEVL
ncbi:hydrogenase maturation nickel metallochaperone HypA [Rhodovulum sp. DZ06]|uniref:hydrogenase maturation nickel metallochaperone HypA n=1 Tax=Rhodovulum sp. DZ06 TaxID=3425126 RepID=UPI003D353F00